MTNAEVTHNYAHSVWTLADGMKIITTLLGLTLSGSAFAGAVAGLIACFDSMSGSEGGGSSSGICSVLEAELS